MGCREIDLGLMSPGNQKDPRSKASREAAGLGGRSPGHGMSSPRTHSWARGRPANPAGHCQSPEAQQPIRGSSDSALGKAGSSAQNMCPLQRSQMKEPYIFRHTICTFRRQEAFWEDSAHSHTFPLNNTSTHIKNY